MSSYRASSSLDLRRRWLGWLGVATLAISLGTCLGTLISPSAVAIRSALTWLAAGVLAGIAWPTLRRRSIVGLILVYGFLGFGVAAALLYHPTANNSTPRVLREVANQTHGYQYLLVFLITAAAAWSSCLAVSRLSRRAPGPFSATPILHIPPRALLFAVLPLTLTIYGVGPNTLFHAYEYLESSGPITAVRLGNALAPIAVVLCGYFFFDHRSSNLVRASGLSLGLIYEAVFLATATRFFAFSILLFLAGGLLTGTWGPRQIRIALIVMGTSVLISIQIPIGLRELPRHGFVPAVHYLLFEPSRVFGGNNPVSNILLGAPLALYVGNHVGSLPASDVATSLNPLPSHFNNWYQIEPRLHVNDYTPFSAIGELLNHGWALLFIVMCLAGVGFGFAERLATRLPGLGGELGRIALYGLAALFVVQTTEYHLRSVSRLVYYAIIGVALASFGLSLFSSRRGRSA